MFAIFDGRKYLCDVISQKYMKSSSSVIMDIFFPFLIDAAELQIVEITIILKWPWLRYTMYAKYCRVIVWIVPFLIKLLFLGI